MASEKLFEGIPPFPDNVVTMPMHTISLADLLSGNEQTARQVLKACQELGFFLLDLRGNELGEDMMGEIDQLFGVGKDVLSLPDDVKNEYLHNIPKSFLGFKPRGQAKTETNEPDRFEWFNLGQDGLMGTKPLQPLPSQVSDHLALFKSFLGHGQSITSAINTALALQLSLPADAFTSLQDPRKPSGSVIRVIRAFALGEEEEQKEEPRTNMIHHTDFGTVTLLANVVGGLQILPPGAGNDASDPQAWRWVKPQPGCLIVNLGDAMVQWTGGALRSNVHRVRCAPGEQRRVDRYSLAILARAQHDASMRSMMGGEEARTDDDELSAWEWEVKKAMSLKRGETVMESKGGVV